MSIELSHVDIAEKEALAELVNEYLKEHCQHQEVRVGPETVADYVYFPEYWREKGRFPYFIKASGAIVGFVLVRTVYEAEGSFYQVSDFYITPLHQRQGYGKRALAVLWQMFPGRWELQVLAKNQAGRHFWSVCITEYASSKVFESKVTEPDGTRYQYNFEVGNAS